VVQLSTGRLARLRGVLGWQGALAQLAQAVVGGLPVAVRLRGQGVLPEGQFHVAALGDGQGVLQGLRIRGEQLGHLVGGLEIALRVGAQPLVGVLEGDVVADGRQHVGEAVVLAPGIVHVVGGHQGEAQRFGQVGQIGH